MTPRSCRSLSALRHVLALGITALAALAAPAMAGPSRESSGGALSRTTSDVNEKTSSNDSHSPSDSSGGSSDDSDSSDADSSSSDDYDSGAGYYSSSSGGCYDCTPVYAPGAYNPQLPELHVSVDLGLQSVHDSDGAAMAAVRILSTYFGLAFTGTRYFEEAPAFDGTNMIHMNLWSIVAEGRLLHTGKTTLWMQGGAGGVTSNQFEPLTGLALGAKLEHRVNPNLDFYASARYFILPESMGASEFAGGIGVSFLNLGYRTFAFDDAGEALHGPEFGVSFGF